MTEIRNVHDIGIVSIRNDDCITTYTERASNPIALRANALPIVTLDEIKNENNNEIVRLSKRFVESSSSSSSTSPPPDSLIRFILTRPVAHRIDVWHAKYVGAINEMLVYTSDLPAPCPLFEYAACGKIRRHDGYDVFVPSARTIGFHPLVWSSSEDAATYVASYLYGRTTLMSSYPSFKSFVAEFDEPSRKMTFGGKTDATIPLTNRVRVREWWNRVEEYEFYWAALGYLPSSQLGAFVTIPHYLCERKRLSQLVECRPDLPWALGNLVHANLLDEETAEFAMKRRKLGKTGDAAVLFTPRELGSMILTGILTPRDENVVETLTMLISHEKKWRRKKKTKREFVFEANGAIGPLRRRDVVESANRNEKKRIRATEYDAEVLSIHDRLVHTKSYVFFNDFVQQTASFRKKRPNLRVEIKDTRGREIRSVETMIEDLRRDDDDERIVYEVFTRTSFENWTNVPRSYATTVARSFSVERPLEASEDADKPRAMIFLDSDVVPMVGICGLLSYRDEMREDVVRIVFVGDATHTRKAIRSEWGYDKYSPLDALAVPIQQTMRWFPNSPTTTCNEFSPSTYRPWDVNARVRSYTESPRFARGKDKRIAVVPQTFDVHEALVTAVAKLLPNDTARIAWINFTHDFYFPPTICIANERAYPHREHASEGLTQMEREEKENEIRKSRVRLRWLRRDTDYAAVCGYTTPKMKDLLECEFFADAPADVCVVRLDADATMPYHLRALFNVSTMGIVVVGAEVEWIRETFESF